MKKILKEDNNIVHSRSMVIMLVYLTWRYSPKDLRSGLREISKLILIMAVSSHDKAVAVAPQIKTQSLEAK
jgi:hypothetical protein